MSSTTDGELTEETIGATHPFKERSDGFAGVTSCARERKGDRPDRPLIAIGHRPQPPQFEQE